MIAVKKEVRVERIDSRLNVLGEVVSNVVCVETFDTWQEWEQRCDEILNHWIKVQGYELTAPLTLFHEEQKREIKFIPTVDGIPV